MAIVDSKGLLMRLIPPTDYMFLSVERGDQPMHVGGLQLLTPPPDAGADFARRLRDSWASTTDVAPAFRRRPAATSAFSPLRFFWDELDEVDLDYHVRLRGLPRPGRVRDLLEVVSHWHSVPLDRHYPLWEMYVVEGLEDGRVAVFTKFHHALFDGVSALLLLQESLSPDPDARDLPAFFAARERTARSTSGRLDLVKSTVDLTADVIGAVPKFGRLLTQVVRDPGRARPLAAPRMIFNDQIGPARRFAAQSYGIERVKNAAHGLGCTVNDIVLAMCSGALRRYLLELDALPDESLVAFVPVSVRSKSDTEGGGNAVGAALAVLGTQYPDVESRLSTITTSMGQAKDVLAELDKTQILALSAAMMSPLYATSSVEGLSQVLPPTANVTISNVPGPRETLYYNGARLDGFYPASVVMDRIALNITVIGNNDSLEFGITGSREVAPRLQRLLAYLDDALGELEVAAGR